MRVVSSVIILLFSALLTIPNVNSEEVHQIGQVINPVPEIQLEPQELELQTSDQNIDPIITGTTVDKDHMAKWEIESARYKECPECVASQPFPED